MDHKKSTKPAILLYNPPATLDKKSWIEPLPLNVLSICSLINQEQYNFSISQDPPDGAFLAFSPLLDSAVCLGISCMTGIQISRGLSLAKKIKSIKGKLPIVWGGYHPTALPEQTAMNSFVDVVVTGYGEETFAELVDVFSNGRSFDDIQGITFRKNGLAVSTPERPARSLNDLPSLPYHLYDIESYFKRISSRSLRYVSSRGCPHHCGFCADHVIYKSRWNPLSANRVIAELEYLKKKYDYEYVQFYDSNLFVDERRVQDICIGVINKKLNFQWVRCNADALIISRYKDQTLDLMKRAGISNVLLGVESGYPAALECISKPANLDQICETVRRLHSKGICIGFSCIFGFPYDLPKDKLSSEHRKEIIETMKLISRFSEDFVPGDYYLFFIYTPYPGVKLFERYKELGYNPPSDFEGWAGVNLYELNGNPWLSAGALQSYLDCLKINWFLMRKLRRNIFPRSKNKIIEKLRGFIDSVAVNALRSRINRGQIKIPFLLLCISYYFYLRDKNGKEIYLKAKALLKKKLINR